jgi:beta-mannanase
MWKPALSCVCLLLANCSSNAPSSGSSNATHALDGSSWDGGKAMGADRGVVPTEGAVGESGRTSACPVATCGSADLDSASLTTAHVQMGVVSDMAPLGPQSTPGTFENMVGRKMAINGAHYYVWTDTSFPGDGESSDAEAGIASMITWMEETDGSDGSLAAVDVDGIASGTEDSVITAAAGRVKAFGEAHPKHTIYMRIFHEMNGEWEPWNAYGGPAIIDAWRHIHDLFVEAGVTNVSWVFCPNASDIPSTSANRFYDYYPGSSYVDLVGDDVYPGAGSSFSSAVGYVYDYNHVTSGWQKPILIAETATTGSDPVYLQDMESDVKTMWTDIMGIVWFNRDYATSSDPTGANLTVSQSPAFLAQYELFLQDPYFGLYSE